MNPDLLTPGTRVRAKTSATETDGRPHHLAGRTGTVERDSGGLFFFVVLDNPTEAPYPFYASDLEPENPKEPTP